MKKAPCILAIETSTDVCSVALTYDEEIAWRHEIRPRDHVQIVLVLIDALFLDAGLSLSDCNAIAFGRGPGSFTGLRIAASLAQGLAFGKNLPVVSVSSLQVLAQTAFNANRDIAKENPIILVVNDARMQEVYWGVYQINEAGLACELQPDTLSSVSGIVTDYPIDYVTGSAWFSNTLEGLPRYPAKQHWVMEYPNAVALLELARQQYVNGGVIPAAVALPLYLRDNVTHQK